MFALVRLLFSLLVVAIIVWFATTVPLGSRTLWGHLRAIGETQEAKDLAAGTKAEAKKVAERVFGPVDAGAPDLARATRTQSGRPLDEVGEGDRRALEKLTKKKAHGTEPRHDAASQH